MWFSSRFRYERRQRGRHAPEPEGQAGHPSRVAEMGEEVDALFAGRLVEHLVARRRAVPPWAALNRLAHADRDELLEVLGGADDAGGSRGGRTRPWAISERMLAFRILASARDDDELRGLQQVVLVPLEWSLLDQYKRAPLTVRHVFEAASDAVGQHLTDR